LPINDLPELDKILAASDPVSDFGGDDGSDTSVGGSFGGVSTGG